ncbi:MAG: hypothetical protein PHO63_01820 [Bacilli bacterium]|nr:hypothetical protein [Bacilli bacterium]MDD4809101.1 hypothetical protein [Bacilli bacterium]
MRRAQIKVYAEITELKHHMTINQYYYQVSSDNPNEIKYEAGMISFKFYHIAIMYKDGEIVKEILDDKPKTYYFGEFTSTEEIKRNNKDGKLDILIENIERNQDSNYIGMVTSPTGFHSLVNPDDIVIEAKIKDEHFQNKIKILAL